MMYIYIIAFVLLALAVAYAFDQGADRRKKVKNIRLIKIGEKFDPVELKIQNIRIYMQNSDVIWYTFDVHDFHIVVKTGSNKVICAGHSYGTAFKSFTTRMPDN